MLGLFSGHSTQPAIESVYSEVPIHNIHLILLMPKLYDLTIYQAAVRKNAYLEAFTEENIYFITGREFTTFGMEHHILIISKVLYEFYTSGKWLHEGFTDMLCIEGFTPCKVNSDVWM